ncbi:hypothetical protein RHGRI_020224 [Rhododendron griersonianum]|uniref:Ubiquitin-like protease family profile domain-containing protein n=1 Tax=Rhododendron griersonianum TaxID=479676 RepID=A0AAV6JJH3_9ERIC|nr:hypothetical protein RHGRI_020224 [Rhododendron griersonianum]
MRARKNSPSIAGKKTTDQKEDDDDETQIKETEQEKNDIETPQKRRASQKSPVQKTPSRRITRSLTKRGIRTRVSKKMEATIEIKKKPVRKSNRNKETGNEEEDDVVVLEEDDEEDEHEDDEEDEQEDDEEDEQEDEEESEEDEEDVEEDEEEDKFVKAKGKKKKSSPRFPKKRVKQQEGKKEKQENEEVVEIKKESCQYRSNLVSLVRLLKRRKFTPLQVREIKKTPFANLLFAMTKPEINELFVRKSDEITLKLVEKYKGEGYFDLGGKLVKISVKDLTLIFGIKSGPTKIHLQGSPRRPISDFLDKVFKKEKEMLVSRMKIFLREAFTERSIDSAQDVARVLMMLVLATIFVPLSQPKLSWAYCPFIEDLNTSTTYAWSTFITEHLVKELDTKHTNPTTVGGCVLGLLYWLCEHTSIMNMQQSKETANCPRFMKWDMCDLPEAFARTPLESLNPEMVKDAELEPNNEKEKKLLHLLEQIEDESDVKDDDTQECSLDQDGSKSEKDEEVKDTNNDNNNLISDLLKEIDRLKEEGKEKDKVIQTLQQKIAELERDHVPYEDAAEQMFDYETEVGTVHVEKGILQEEIVQKEVEIGGLYVSNELLEEKLEKSEKEKASFEDGLDDMVTHSITQEYHVRKTSLHKYVAISVCISVGICLDKEEDKEKRQEEEESKEGGVDQTMSERVEIATGLHDEILSDEVIDKTICQIFKDTLEGERKEEKKRKGEQDDIDPPSMVKDLLDNEEDKEKRQEEEESKEGGVDQTMSERVEIATGFNDEILSDEVIASTICQFSKVMHEGERKEEKKRKREQDNIDPPSMVKDLKSKDDRTVKSEEGFIYYGRNPKERKKSNSVFEMTKLFNYISKEDMDLLDTIYQFEKEDKKAFVWQNQVNNDTVTIEDVLNLLNEGDIGNTCIDGLTYILERQEEKTAKTQGNSFYITSTCWTLIKEKAEARANLINGKLKELDQVIDINGVAFYKYLIFPMNSMGGRKVKVPDHWTLLVYDTSKQQWMHYNSLTKPKKKKNPYLTDASIVKEYVEEQMRKLAKPPSFELVSTPKPTLFPTNTLSAPISSIDDAPQQQPGSVDCGIIVCYIIKQLVEQKPVPTYLTVENLKKFRAELIHIFLNDKPRTWSTEEWKSNQLMRGMAI